MEQLLAYARKFPTFSVLEHSRLPIADHNILLAIIAYNMQWTDKTMQELAEEGNLPVMKWARENGCPWNKYVCACAAQNGHLDCLKFLRSDPDNLCSWDRNACANAAQNGHLECLKFLRSNTDNLCPCDWRACAYAAENGHLECLKFLRSDPYNLCPWNKDACIRNAHENNHQHIVNWIQLHD